MNINVTKPNGPWQSLLILLGVTLACSVGIQLIVVVLGIVASGGVAGFFQNQKGLYEQSFFLYAMLVSSSIGTFFLPALLLQRLEPYFSYFPSNYKNHWALYILAVMVLFSFGPIMQLVGEANMQMNLPDMLKGLEDWMRRQEESMAQLTEKVVMVDSLGGLFVNILVMAVVPAIAEEYYFRGSLMHIIQRVSKNHHVAVWLSAIIFSAIHIQFFGFFPRMILGVFFGYMFVWTQNIWIPILAHFVNNAAVTVIAFLYTRQGKSFADLQAYDNYSIFVYIGSLVLTVLLGLWIYKISKTNRYNGKRLDKAEGI